LEFIGTGAISHKHAQAYKNIGYELTVCTDINAESGRAFATQYGCQFVPAYEELCQHPRVDYVDVCTFPDFRLQPLRLCAAAKKHVQVQKPIPKNLAFWPVYTERVEINETKGTMVTSADELINWYVQDDSGILAPMEREGALRHLRTEGNLSCPVRTTLADLGNAIRLEGNHCQSGDYGYRALRGQHGYSAIIPEREGKTIMN
jgi:Oxidoreductase family, NAD-binding Rossmann fold